MSHRIAWYYDNRSNVTCVLDPEDGLTYFTYDTVNRMTSVKNPFGEVTYYDYTPGSRLSRKLMGNGCVTYYDYDLLGRTSKVDNRKSDLSVISSFEYERDVMGNPISILREDGSAVYYEYDAKDQLTKETQRDAQGEDLYAYEWDYDAAGNRTQQTFNGDTTDYVYNEVNQLTRESVDGTHTYYDYDRCGNTTAKQEPTGNTYFHWDHENLLTRVDLPDGTHNYFAYDADSKRVEKRDSEGYTRFIYQGPNMLALLQERDENDSMTAHYTMGAGLEAMRRDSTSSFYHFDQLGSTFNLTDANEDATDAWLYNAWGEVLDRTGTTDNPHIYIGRERYYWTPEPVLYLLGVRYYDGRPARFLSLDALREQVNWYLYAGNSPRGRADPTGLAYEEYGEGGCHVYFWIGDTTGQIWDPHRAKWVTSSVETMRIHEQMVTAMRRAKDIILQKRGYKVWIRRDGLAVDLEYVFRHYNVVGVAAVSHGGCITGWNDAVWNVDVGSKTVGALSSMSGSTLGMELPYVYRRAGFQYAYFGHCYGSQYDPNYPSVAGDLRRCRELYKYGTGLHLGSILTPRQRDLRTGIVQWDTIASDLQWFARSLLPCCDPVPLRGSGPHYHPPPPAPLQGA